MTAHSSHSAFDPESEVRPEDTRRALLDAALDLFRERFLDQITLEELATRAGCTLEATVAFFGTRENVFPEIASDLAGRMASARFAAPPGDVPTAVTVLLGDYEAWGDVLVRALSQEQRIPALRPFLQLGRTLHRDWVEKTFADALEEVDSEQRRLRVAQLVAVCDVAVWHLLRRGSELSASDTRAAMIGLVESLLARKPA